MDVLRSCLIWDQGIPEPSSHHFSDLVPTLKFGAVVGSTAVLVSFLLLVVVELACIFLKFECISLGTFCFSLEIPSLF